MVSEEYLAKVRFAVRRNSSKQINEELNDIVEQCREDLIRMGVAKSVAESEENKLVLGCQRAYARWQFGINGDDVKRNREDYQSMANDLRKSVLPEEEEI